jgi:hypothetical protein
VPLAPEGAAARSLPARVSVAETLLGRAFQQSQLAESGVRTLGGQRVTSPAGVGLPGVCGRNARRLVVVRVFVLAYLSGDLAEAG